MSDQLPPHKMLWPVAVCLTLLCACEPRRRPSAPPPPVVRIPIFDDAATKPERSNIIAQVDRDWPGDEWTTGMFHENISRNRRVAPIAREILGEIKPKLKRTTVTELMQSLKVHDGSGFVTNYIADGLYPEGNKMILAEIKSRPASERLVLRSWPHDDAYLDTGSQGEGMTMGELVFELGSPASE